jgi:hypothetical protein
MITVPWLRKQPKTEATVGRWPLEMPLLKFSGKDSWRLRDSFEGLAIFGQTGSGKTSGSGRLIARKFLRNGFGGLVVCAKRNEADLWRSYLKETGRESDARFFSVDSDLRFNFIDHESKTSNLDFVENLVNLLVDISSVKKRSTEGGNQAFWMAERKKLVRNSISLLLLAGQPIEIRSLYNLIASSPRTLDQVKSTDWRNSSYMFSLLLSAHKLNGNHEEFGLVDNYFMQERLELHGGTRGTVDAEFTGTFDSLRRGKIGQLFGTSTNISPEDILDGRIVVIDIAVDTWREIGQYAAVTWIQMLMRAVDRRSYAPPETRPVFLWEDESHKFTIEQDADFQSGARSKGIATVRIAQNLPLFLDAFGPGGRHKVDALLGNHATKLFHRNDCPITNKWSSELIAKETVYRPSLSSSASGDSATLNTSLAQVEEECCQAKEFLGLKTGGPGNKLMCEAIIFQSGRLFNGERWIVGEFSQR